MLEPLALALAAPAAAPPHLAEAVLARLEGCWRADGEVEGKPVRNVARLTPRLARRYFLLELHGLDPADPYDAAVVMAPGKAPDAVVAWWMDSFGGAYSAAGSGRVADDALTIDYPYPDATFVNRLTPAGAGWRWTITSRKPGAAETPFASYALARISCAGLRFAF